MRSTVAVGAGRMGRGIALAYVLANRPVTVLDLRPRTDEGYEVLAGQVHAEVSSTLEQLAGLGVLPADRVDATAALVEVAPVEAAEDVLAGAGVVYEGVPETREAKADALPRLAAMVDQDTVIASTTSTMLSTELAALVPHPERFLNAHWLNPAFLHLVVEVSPHPGTAPEALATLRADLESIGRMPVQCAPSPGFIVPRLQALVMNEAARMVAEGVATAEDIDLATRFGFGLRFASVGVLEFIDYGGADILYHADRYLAETVDERRYAVPDVIAEHMREGREGLRSGEGFYDYEPARVDGYREDVLRRTLAMARFLEQERDRDGEGLSGQVPA